MFSPNPKDKTPLPERVRPETFDELMGQEHLTDQNAALYNLVERDAFDALLFWGPPGSGKTTLARAIARRSERRLIELSAVQSGVKDIRHALEESENERSGGHKSILLFMDEIHHLNKSQQDILLPALEKGLVKFIGATTENPSFEVNRAILSRCLVFKFERLSTEALARVIKRALTHEKGAFPQVSIRDDAIKLIANSADGDARRCLNLLNAVVHAFGDRSDEITIDELRKLGPSFVTAYDKSGDQHYDIVSAMIKSIRASHPDAALYYLARMLDAGEDIMFLARRIVIAASEDVGNANPTALLVATAAMQAAHMVGMPEARIILAQAVTYLASSPKSNRSYEGINKALADVKAYGSLEVPLHLRNATTKLMQEFGYGKLYAYAHSDPEGARKLPYLPEKLKGRRYYEPSNSGAEAQLKHNLDKIRPIAD